MPAVAFAGIAIGGIAAQQEPGEPPQGPLRPLHVEGQPYHTPLAGEGFTTTIFGKDVEVPPRSRRSVSAWDLGVSLSPGADRSQVLPFGSLYFWRHPDDDTLFRATIVGLYDDIRYAKSPEGWGDFEWLGTFENFTVPFATSELVDGVTIEDESLYWGYVRPGIGLGFREQIAPGYNDNMFASNVVVEPGLLYFHSGDQTADDFEVPETTFELRAHWRTRYDALVRNLLELPHSGFAAGTDLIYGWRANWSAWGTPGTESYHPAGDGRDYLQFTGYALGVGGVPFVDSDRHRILASVFGGIGDDTDRFSAQRVGGGPDPRGEEYGSVSRPVLMGAVIDEFYPRHYVIGTASYRYEATFFTYLDVGAQVAWLDRDRFVNGAIERRDDMLTAVGARITSGFLGKTRVQIGYAYNFDIVRDGELGGSALVVNVSGSF